MSEDEDIWRDLAPRAGEGKPDPLSAARAASATPAPKRFYREVSVEPREGGFAVLLDGRAARTPGRRLLLAPTAAAGEAAALEWRAQGAEIRPATMPLTRLLATAVDGVADAMAAVADEIVRYAGSDLVCYRAGDPRSLVEAQAAAWDPVLDFARESLGARFVLSEGVTFVAQPEPALAAVRARVEAERSPHALAALSLMTTLSGSALIALCVADGRLSVEEAWAAAHVDEAHQERLWGTDALAAERRAARERDFRAAATLHALAR